MSILEIVLLVVCAVSLFFVGFFYKKVKKLEKKYSELVRFTDQIDN